MVSVHLACCGWAWEHHRSSRQGTSIFSWVSATTRQVGISKYLREAPMVSMLRAVK